MKGAEMVDKAVFESIANSWWKDPKTVDKFTPFAWCGNPQFVNVPAILAAFSQHLLHVLGRE